MNEKVSHTFFFKRGSHCESLADLKLTHLYLLGVGIKGMCHQFQFSTYLFYVITILIVVCPQCGGLVLVHSRGYQSMDAQVSSVS